MISDLNSTLSRYFKDERYNRAFFEVPMPEHLFEAKLAFEEVFGKKIITVKTEKDWAIQFKGVTLNHNNIFVNIDVVNSERFNLFTVAAHELLHSIKLNNIKLYQDFADYAVKYIKKGGLSEYEKYTNLMDSAENYDKDYILEELLADFVGDSVTDPKFLKTLSSENPELFEKLFKAIVAFFTKLSDKLRGFGSYKYFDGIDELQSKLNEVLSEFSKDGSKGVAKVKFSLSQRTKKLAPNGEPSNLTEQQYQQVRTPEFKKWFGDWDSNAEDTSQVIDENGEPLVVYHGGVKGINVFKEKKFRLDAGFYFSNKKSVATEYASKYYGEDGFVYSSFLNIKKFEKDDNANHLSFNEFIDNNGGQFGGYLANFKDGVKISNLYDSPDGDTTDTLSDIYAVRQSSQIKLAIDNDDDIRFGLLNDKLPAIFNKTESAYIKSEVKKAKLNKKSPGYDAQIEKLSEQYHQELDDATTKLTFEQYKSLPDNANISENLLKLGYDGLQETELSVDDVKFSLKSEHNHKLEKIVYYEKILAEKHPDNKHVNNVSGKKRQKISYKMNLLKRELDVSLTDVAPTPKKPKAASKKPKAKIPKETPLQKKRGDAVKKLNDRIRQDLNANTDADGDADTDIDVEYELYEIYNDNKNEPEYLVLLSDDSEGFEQYVADKATILVPYSDIEQNIIEHSEESVVSEKVDGEWIERDYTIYDTHKLDEILDNGLSYAMQYQEKVEDIFNSWNLHDIETVTSGYNSNYVMGYLNESDSENGVDGIKLRLSSHDLPSQYNGNNAGFDYWDVRNVEYLKSALNEIAILYKLKQPDLSDFDDTVKFSLAGVKSRIADISKLEHAHELESQGKSVGEIWQSTGWIKGYDDKWRFEIDDSQAVYKLKLSGIKSYELYAGKLDEVLDFPDLFESYPFLRDIEVRIAKGYIKTNSIGGGGAFLSKHKVIYLGVTEDRDGDEFIHSDTKQAEQFSSLLHEVQHAIQFEENFAIGTSMVAESVKYKIQALAEQKDINAKMQGRYSRADIKPEKIALASLNYSYNLEAEENYIKNFGEAEAREVQARIGKTALERAKSPPKWDGVSKEDAIVLEL